MSGTEPRVWTDEPLTIAIVRVESPPSMDDPLGSISFGIKTQCQKCRVLLAIWTSTAWSIPLTDGDIRRGGAMLLETHGCVLDGEVTCSSCATDGKDTRASALLLSEGVVPPKVSDWPTISWQDHHVQPE